MDKYDVELEWYGEVLVEGHASFSDAKRIAEQRLRDEAQNDWEYADINPEGVHPESGESYVVVTVTMTLKTTTEADSEGEAKTRAQEQNPPPMDGDLEVELIEEPV